MGLETNKIQTHLSDKRRKTLGIMLFLLPGFLISCACFVFLLEKARENKKQEKTNENKM
jgi:hypothetical protein